MKVALRILLDFVAGACLRACSLIMSRQDTGCPKKMCEQKIISKIECCGAKFNARHDLGALDPTYSLTNKQPKNTNKETKVFENSEKSSQKKEQLFENILKKTPQKEYQFY